MRESNRIFREVPRLAALVSLATVTGLARAEDATAPGGGSSGEKSVVVRAEDGGKSAGKRPNRRLLREGTFVSDRQGWLKPVGAERWAMVWDGVLDPQTGATTVDPPMAVLPCLKLMEMRRIVEARPETVTFRVSGRVLVYKGRNYLLPTFFMTLADSGGKAPGSATGEMSDEARNEARQAFDDLMGRSGSPGEPTGGAEEGAQSNDPDAILRGIDKATPNVSIPVAPNGADGGNGTNGGASRIPVTGDGMHGDQRWKLVREGTMLTARRGRLLRGPLGEFVFAPDNGTGTDRSTRKRADNAAATPKGTGEPKPAAAPAAVSEADTMLLGPMRLIPCLNLQEMERLTQTHAVALEFKVSGQVFVYDGRNYLLPTMYLIEADRDGNVTAGQ